MDVMTAMKNRRSVRSYSSKEVESEKLDKVLEAARLAPTARNQQDFKIVVITDKKRIHQLQDACNGQEFVSQAPVFIAICALRDGGNMSCGIPRHVVDCSIAMTHMILAAYEQGLGTCWLGSYKQDQVKKLLKVPEEAVVVAVTPLGYPGKEMPLRPRKGLDELISYQSF